MLSATTLGEQGEIAESKNGKAMDTVLLVLETVQLARWTRF
jgi:hypothetical protein